jgi:hypothetical protein
MLGLAKPRRLDEPIAISLEALVPGDHFYRHLEAKLDLTFVREWVRELYAERGRPSIDPIVFFKLRLVMFFEGIRSERYLIATASLNLAHRWYLGYALDEKLPDHSSLTRIRQRLGIATFISETDCVASDVRVMRSIELIPSVGLHHLVAPAPQPALAGADVEADVPAIAASVRQDPAKTAASLRGAAGADILDPIGERVAAVIARRAGGPFRSHHAFLDHLLRHLVGHVGDRMPG